MIINIYLQSSNNKARNNPDFEIENATEAMFDQLYTDVNSTSTLKPFIKIGPVIFEKEKFKMATLE